jgi:hypothetical protein
VTVGGLVTTRETGIFKGLFDRPELLKVTVPPYVPLPSPTALTLTVTVPGKEPFPGLTDSHNPPEDVTV